MISNISKVEYSVVYIFIINATSMQNTLSDTSFNNFMTINRQLILYD